MNCNHCHKYKAVVHLGYSQDVCKKCFLRLLEARVRKYSRLHKVFRRDDHILTIDPLTHFLIKRIITELPIKVYYKNMNISDLRTVRVKRYIKTNKINKTIIPWTIDDECCLFLERLFRGKSVISPQYFSLLHTMTDEEALLFAKFNNFKFIPHTKNKDIQSILDAMQTKYPETKFSFVKSIEEMHKVLGK